MENNIDINRMSRIHERYENKIDPELNKRIKQRIEEMYREEQMELMKDFWHGGSMKELVQTLTHTISKEEKEELKDLIDDLDD